VPNKYTLFRAQRVASKLFCKIEAGLIFICKRSERNESLLSFPSGAPQTKNTPRSLLRGAKGERSEHLCESRACSGVNTLYFCSVGVPPLAELGLADKY